MVQSVERAFAVLDAVAERPAGVTALAVRLGLPKSTTARLLGSLERLGAVERVDGRLWRVGPRVEALTQAVAPARSLAALARPELMALVAAVGEDAGLAVPEGYDVLYVEQVECDHPVQVRDWTGTKAPLHTVPSGLVLLAEWPENAVDAYCAGGLARLTPNTVTAPKALRRRLAETRRAGYAWGREEYAEGITSVAAPVRDGRGNALAAVHLHGPSYRFPAAGEEARVGAAVVATAAAVSRRLAHEKR
jgi:IclR family transcriptional regulator, KDG regulon repressor